MSTESIGNLGDIPDLSGVGDASQTEPFAEGWYEGVIVEQRAFTDQNGNERVFESVDAPAANGASRNIRLQVQIRRKADGRELNTSTLVNYRPEDLTPETVQAVTERAKSGGNQMGDLFRPFMTLTRLSRLQKIAGVRQLQRNGNGGLDLKPIFGKKAYFRLKDDDRSGGKYKEIVDFQADPPRRSPVL